MVCRPSVSKKSFRHAVRIFKLSKKFKNTCRLNAKGAFCPLHTSPAALSQTFSARFFDSLSSLYTREPSLSGIRPWFVRRWYIRRGSWSGRICNAPLRCVSRHRSPVGADYISARNPARRDRGPGGCGALRRGVGTPPYGLRTR